MPSFGVELNGAPMDIEAATPEDANTQRLVGGDIGPSTHLFQQPARLFEGAHLLRRTRQIARCR